MRFMLFDQCASQDQGFHFGPCDDHLKEIHVGNHSLRLIVSVCPWRKILRYSVPQLYSLADIDNDSPAVMHKIDAGKKRQIGRFPIEFISRHNSKKITSMETSHWGDSRPDSEQIANKHIGQCIDCLDLIGTLSDQVNGRSGGNTHRKNAE